MRSVVVALAFLLLAPLASAAVPPIVAEGTEIVYSHSSFSFSTFEHCSSADPALGAISTDLTSRLTHAPEGSRTRYTMHLDAIPGDASCPAIDLTFLSSAPWPVLGEHLYGDVVTDCGASGGVMIDHYDSGVLFTSFWNVVPGSCGWTIPSSTTVSSWIQPAQPSPTLVCSPLVFSGCTGASEQTHPLPGSCQQESFDVSAGGLVLLNGRHGCEFWTDNHEYAAVGDGFGFVSIVATEDSCTLRVGDFFGGPVQNQVACPAEIGAIVYGMDWHGILP